MLKRLIATFTAMMLLVGSAVPVYAENTSAMIAETAAETTAEQTPESTDAANAQEIGITGGKTTENDEIANDADDQTSQDEDKDEDSGDSDKEKTEDEDDQDKEDKKETDKISKYQKGLAAYIRSKNKNLSKSWSITLAGYFIKSGEKNDVDPKVLMALALRESNFRAKAKSKYGYKGIMQCSDAFAKRYGYEPSDLYKASVSIEIAAKYIKKMKKKYKTYTNAICCYICGSGAVAKGTHSKEPGRSVMNVRNNIKKFLKENGYA